MGRIQFIRLINMAYIFLKSIAAIQAYKIFGIDFTYPIKVNAQLNNECNSKCNMCDVWHQNKRELPASFWIGALQKLKLSFGNFNVAFAGGEVLLKNDVYEIFEFCHDNKIPFSITTNGKLLTAYHLDRLLKLSPVNINISIDSLDPTVYSRIRGVNFLESVKSNIDYLMMCIERKSSDTKVFLKTVVNNLNLNELHSIANYASDMKVAGITFDPIRRQRKIFLEGEIDEFEIMANVDMNLHF
jgi:MoaA/NifB/PqqE/SkfB family radical SAM enzyme